MSSRMSSQQLFILSWKRRCQCIKPQTHQSNGSLRNNIQKHAKREHTNLLLARKLGQGVLEDGRQLHVEEAPKLLGWGQTVKPLQIRTVFGAISITNPDSVRSKPAISITNPDSARSKPAISITNPNSVRSEPDNAIESSRCDNHDYEFEIPFDCNGILHDLSNILTVPSFRENWFPRRGLVLYAFPPFFKIYFRIFHTRNRAWSFLVQWTVPRTCSWETFIRDNTKSRT